MNPERWSRVQDLFEAALERPEGARRAWLESACASDATLVEEVLALLDADTEDRLGPIVARAAETILADDDEAPVDGRRIGPYRLLREIGRGGMGVVYLACRDDGEFSQRVAIKVVRGRLSNPGLAARFRKEREILARLQHPNIARLLDGGTTGDGEPFVVMEHVEGAPIDRYCARHELSLRDRLRLFGDLCGAVQYAHRNLIVHRDLKPANVLVTPDGVVKLLDFGVARLLDAPGEPDGSTTGTDARALTPRYASPEQIRGETISTATDVYSLGVMLYELLTGRGPYDADPTVPGELEKAICEQPTERPSAAVTRDRGDGPVPPFAARRLAGDLDNIVLRAMRKEPEGRYASAAELADDVRRHLDGLPVAARPATWAYRARKFFGRYRLAAASVAIVGLTLIATTVVSTTLYVRASRAETTASEVNRFLREMLGSVDPAIAQGADVALLRRILEQAARRVDGELRGEPEIAATLLATIGSAYDGLGLWEEGERHDRAALALARSTFGADDPRTIEAMRRLSVNLRRQSRYPESEAVLGEALDLGRARYGGEDVETAANLHARGVLEWEWGRLPEAERSLTRALELRRRLLGERDPQVAESALMLGTVLSTPGVDRHDEAERLLGEALATYRAAGDRYRLQVAETLHNLAESLGRRGLHDRAEAAHLEALEILRELLPEDHPRLAVAINRLAALYEANGDLDTALALYEEAVAIQQRALPPDHRDYATTLNNLAGALRKLGRYDEATPLYREAVAIYRRTLGEDHAWVGIALGSLAASLEGDGEFAECERVADEALRIRGLVWDREHWRIASVASIRAACIAGRGRIAEARPALVDAADRLERALGTDDPRTIEARARVAALTN